MGCCFNAAAQLSVSVHRTGVTNIYKGSCLYTTTTFTVSVYPGNYTGLEVYVYIGGEGDGLNSDEIDSCWAASQHNGGDTTPDFYVSGSGLSEFEFVPHLYELNIPIYQNSADITVTTTNSTSRCTDPYSTVLVKLPDTEDYTGDEYVVDSEAASDTANLYPAPPSISVNVEPVTYPFTLDKSLENSISFTLNSSMPFPGTTTVLFLAGGDGTGTSPVDPCYAISPDDFTVSGYSTTAPFPHGFLVTFNEGESSKMITLTAVDSESDCEDDYQTLLVTVPTISGCSGYSPGYPSQISAEEYP